MEEKRKYPRRKLGCAALFKGGTQALENVRIRDISRGGIFVESQNPTCHGETVIINIDEYNIGRDLGIKGIVVRNIPEYGMGIQILSTTNDDYLREWLSR
ncbi:MAG TPA: PilZ domain-containing protein [Desulfomonilia bacterium]